MTTDTHTTIDRDHVFPDTCPKCNQSAGFHIAGTNPDIIGKCANCSYLLPADDADSNTEN